MEGDGWMDGVMRDGVLLERKLIHTVPACPKHSLQRQELASNSVITSNYILQ